MANFVTFQTQIASVMEVLANAAVAEICKLVEDSYAELQLEISQTKKENNHLKKKLKTIEIRDSFYRRAHKLMNESAAITRSSAHEKVPGRISVKVASLCDNDGSDEDGSVHCDNVSLLQPERLDQESWQPFYQSVDGGDEPDVLIIKEERPDNMRCEQSESETEATENLKDDTQYRSAEVFVTIPRENIIDQNTVQHCRQEVGNCVNQSVGDDEPDVLIIKEERPDNMRCEQPGGETKTAENRETRMDRRCDGEAETKLQPVSSYASWVSGRLDATTNHPSYTESECNGGPSVNQYLMYRGSADPMCSYATPIDSNGLSMPDMEGHLTHSDGEVVDMEVLGVVVTEDFIDLEHMPTLPALSTATSSITSEQQEALWNARVTFTPPSPTVVLVLRVPRP
ncbi:hypothetical protein DPX16_16230 [Anabarilius grahami]|uniref:Uncharacterized protein n=1 Tax=Anabarilius grahami TaxID=495550 RepID=A0A3N0XJW7_ANAGA|nr:hypothetical protein DPX16_16230 [Anabarilius grahami]